MTQAPTLARPVLLEPTSAQNVLDNVERLLPLVAAEAARGEQEARLSPVVADAFRRAGFFQMGFARRVGGLEMSVHDQVRVIARIARVDAGTAWNVGVLNATGYYACRLPDDAYAELYPTRDMPTSGSFHPRGRADRVPGGYLVSGRWDWGSGKAVAEHVIGGCFVFEKGEPVLSPHTGRQLVLGLWLPNDAITPVDNWQVLGQRASGSASYTIDEPAFVPEGHGFDREFLPNANGDPLNKHVTTVFYGLLGVHLGLAQHAVDLAYEAVERRAAGGGSAKVDTATQRLLGQAIAEVDVASSYVADVARRTDEILFTPGRLLTPVEQARQDTVNLMTGQALHRVLDLCTELYGSYYVYDNDPMQRVARDAHVALSHAGAKPMHWTHTAVTALEHGGRAATLFDEPLVATR